MISLYRLCVISCVIAILMSCSKIPVETFDVDKFYELTNGIEEETTSFLFFTDPHINENNSTFEQYLRSLEYNYNRVPLEFCLCGGDWLNNNDTNQQAYGKLRFIADYTYHVFGDNYYPILGNHDTNYQGRYTNESEENAGMLSHEEIVGLLFYRQENSYYAFERNHVKFLILDTGIDWNRQMDAYRWEQAHWFASGLQTNKSNHIVIAMHIYTNDIDGTKSPELFSQYIMEIADAHNNRKAISLNGVEYDFADAYGKVACVLCGHCHEDFITTSYSIPIVGTTHLKDGNIPTFDLCVFNWKQNVLNLLRVGIGHDRIIYLAQ